MESKVKLYGDHFEVSEDGKVVGKVAYVDAFGYKRYYSGFIYVPEGVVAIAELDVPDNRTKCKVHRSRSILQGPVKSRFMFHFSGECHVDLYFKDKLCNISFVRSADIGFEFLEEDEDTEEKDSGVPQVPVQGDPDSNI